VISIVGVFGMGVSKHRVRSRSRQLASHTPELQSIIQFGYVESSSLHSIGIASEPAEAPRAVKEALCRQPASGLAEHERGNERPAGFGVLFHQTLEGYRELMDGIGWRQLLASAP
jgi:hypothetical protein